MPRSARIKKDYAIYHVMVRSISELNMFEKDEDKERFLGTIKRYKALYQFKVYAYCIMNNHAHLMINSCDADISKFMHCINQSYAQYYNRKYKRHGHVFQDRFKSKIVYNEQYLLRLSAYIHKNPEDIYDYKDNVEAYQYSSLGIYSSSRKDEYMIIDQSYVMDIYKNRYLNNNQHYTEFVQENDFSDLAEEEELFDEKPEYRSERKDVNSPCIDDIIDFVAKSMNIDRSCIHMKNTKKIKKFKCMCIILMRGSANLSIKDICSYIGNINQSTVSKLCNYGIELISSDIQCRKIFRSFLKSNSV
jgi:putative transposase